MPRDSLYPQHPSRVRRITFHVLRFRPTFQNHVSRFSDWTALGIPGYEHPVESMVDRYGLLTPVAGGPSLDYWVDVEGGDGGTMAAGEQRAVLQRLQGGLPVVLTAYEANGLRVSSEVWLPALPEGDYAAMQVVLFNIADVRLRGTFRFALRPYNPAGIAPIYSIAFDGSTLVADGRPGPITWPQPGGWALSDLRGGDLFKADPTYSPGIEQLDYTRGFAHGTLNYAFDIEPWEEAEFLAFVPIHTRTPESEPVTPLFAVPQIELRAPDPQFYSRAKAATALAWRGLLGSGMQISVPDERLQASWEANRMHVLALHSGGTITSGPDMYHGSGFRDAAYVAQALSICGYREAGEQLLRGCLGRQRRDGAFVSHAGEWAGTGQALWALGSHLDLYPDSELLRDARPAVEKARRLLARLLRRSPDSLLPLGVSSERPGLPDRYYWDSLWSLAGLIGADKLLGRSRSRAAGRLRRAILRAWRADAAALGGNVLPAAPGRRVDLGVAGTLVAWFPLDLFPAEPYLRPTLLALEEATFYKGARFADAEHSGWDTYLNMRLAGCRIANELGGGWRSMQRLLDHASPTYTWPEAVHPVSGRGRAGDSHHGQVSAEWLLLVRAMLLNERGNDLHITPELPASWLLTPGGITVERVPTRFGSLSYAVEWDSAGHIRLQLSPEWRTPPTALCWRLPGDIVAAWVDGSPAQVTGSSVILTSAAKEAGATLSNLESD